MDIFLDLLSDVLQDSLSLLPYLFITYLLLECLEHKSELITRWILVKKSPFSPIIGAFLALIPQCGISVAGANFYSAKVITLGTLLAIFLSSSDEMIPIFLSSGIAYGVILKILGVKFLIACCFGLIIDKIFSTKNESPAIDSLCQKMDCHCEKGVFYSATYHTAQIFIFIFSVSLVLNACFYTFGAENLQQTLFENTLGALLLTTLIGMIPNCASSVVLTQLYMSHTILDGAFLAGILANSGLGLIILLRLNRPMKDNFKIILLVFFLSFMAGLLFSLTGYRF